ncbi:MAG: hypothetical protein MUE94_06965 [Verrucomicrobia bacterium]|jgi:mono/diheme cytochrome c family protein|nr:hypothetical protein [Verrucomicrobiota bacterium]
MVLFAGRLHLVLLHLPIGFLVLLGALELLGLHPRWRQAAAANRFILWCIAPVAVLTAACGWLLAESSGYEERLLLLHRWTGVSVAVASCLLLWLYERGWISLYRGWLVAVVGLTLVAGHFGASLTHGSNYLRRYAPFWLGGRVPWVKENELGPDSNALSFVAVETVFGDYCAGCHGPERAKGGLRLDSLEHLRAGGDSGPVVVPGDASGSLLLKRMLLPLVHEDHMPPQGKPQPAKADLERVRAWISLGAAE